MSDVGSPGSNNPGSSPSRRTLLRGMAGIAGLSVAGGLLSACDSSSSTPSDSGSAGVR